MVLCQERNFILPDRNRQRSKSVRLHSWRKQRGYLQCQRDASVPGVLADIVAKGRKHSAMPVPRKDRTVRARTGLPQVAGHSYDVRKETRS